MSNFHSIEFALDGGALFLKKIVIRNVHLVIEKLKTFLLCRSSKVFVRSLLVRCCKIPANLSNSCPEEQLIVSVSWVQTKYISCKLTSIVMGKSQKTPINSFVKCISRKKWFLNSVLFVLICLLVLRAFLY